MDFIEWVTQPVTGDEVYVGLWFIPMGLIVMCYYMVKEECIPSLVTVIILITFSFTSGVFLQRFSADNDQVYEYSAEERQALQEWLDNRKK